MTVYVCSHGGLTTTRQRSLPSGLMSSSSTSPTSRRVEPLVAAISAAEGLDATPTLAVVGSAGLAEASQLEGVVDFVLRPLRLAELVRRVRRQIKTGQRDSSGRIVLGHLVVDTDGFEAAVNGQRLDLTYQEFELLKFLISNPDKAYRRDQLLARVWGYDYYGGSRTVDIHIRRIRAKLGHPYAACIQTIRHVGYKWVNEYE